MTMHSTLPTLGLVLLGLGTLVFAASGAGFADDGLGALRFDKDVHDFGDVGQHQEHAAVFTYSNASDTTVTGIRAAADCGCYGVTLSEVELAPGEAGRLTVRFRTLAFSGKIRKHVQVSYDDGAARSTRLGLVLAVRAGVVFEPGRMHFGEVLAGTRPTGNVRAIYHADVGKPFRVTAVTLPEGDFLPSRPEPYQDPRDPKWKGWRIPFVFARALEKGIYSERAVIETDHPDYPRVTISLTASVVGKVWVQSPRIHLGMVPRGSTRSTSTVIRPFDKTIRLGEVSVKARGGVLQTKLEPAPGIPDVYRLTITVPADAPVGPLDDVIEIHTEVPDEPITELVIHGRVYAPRGG
jgi:hypothetical protein